MGGDFQARGPTPPDEGITEDFQAIRSTLARLRELVEERPPPPPRPTLFDRGWHAVIFAVLCGGCWMLHPGLGVIAGILPVAYLAAWAKGKG